MGHPKLTMQDLIFFITNRSTGKKIDIDTVLPFILLPILLTVATFSLTVTSIIIVMIGLGALYIQTRPRSKNISPFFLSWTLSSAIFMFLILEFEVMMLLEVTLLEHTVFLLLLAFTCYFFYKMKSVADFELATGPMKGKEYCPVLTSESHYCQICQIEVNERYFHSIWWDCCVFRPNYLYFLFGQVSAFITLFYGTNLGFTTLCQPYILLGPILMPEDCTEVYYEFHVALGFVSCVYGMAYVMVICFVLIRQLIIYIPKYCEFQWRGVVNVLNV